MTRTDFLAVCGFGVEAFRSGFGVSVRFFRLGVEDVGDFGYGELGFGLCVRGLGLSPTPRVVEGSYWGGGNMKLQSPLYTDQGIARY